MNTSADFDRTLEIELHRALDPICGVRAPKREQVLFDLMLEAELRRTLGPVVSSAVPPRRSASRPALFIVMESAVLAPEPSLP